MYDILLENIEKIYTYHKDIKRYASTDDTAMCPHFILWKVPYLFHNILLYTDIAANILLQLVVFVMKGMAV